MWSSFIADTIYLDSNIIIYAIESGNRWFPLLRELFEEIDDRAIHAFTSELTLAEVLSKPFKASAHELIDKYEQVLAPDGLIKVIAIDRPILRTAAALQARLNVKLADAIHLATARSHDCDFFLTNDDRLGRKIAPEFRWLELSQIQRGI